MSMSPRSVATVTRRLCPAGSAGGWLVGQLRRSPEPDAVPPPNGFPNAITATTTAAAMPASARSGPVDDGRPVGFRELPAGARPDAARLAARFADRLTDRSRSVAREGVAGCPAGAVGAAGSGGDAAAPSVPAGALDGRGPYAPGGIADPAPRERGGTARPRRREGLMRQPRGRSRSRSPRTGAPRRGCCPLRL